MPGAADGWGCSGRRDALNVGWRAHGDTGGCSEHRRETEAAGETGREGPVLPRCLHPNPIQEQLEEFVPVAMWAGREQLGTQQDGKEFHPGRSGSLLPGEGWNWGKTPQF